MKLIELANLHALARRRAQLVDDVVQIRAADKEALLNAIADRPGLQALIRTVVYGAVEVDVEAVDAELRRHGVEVDDGRQRAPRRAHDPKHPS